MVLFDLSLEPSVLGWYTVDSFSLMLVSLCNVIQNSDTNNLSWSEISSKGNPFSQYHCLKNKSARSSVVIVVCVGIIWMSECRQSVIERIQLYRDTVTS